MDAWEPQEQMVRELDCLRGQISQRKRLQERARQTGRPVGRDTLRERFLRHLQRQVERHATEIILGQR